MYLSTIMRITRLLDKHLRLLETGVICISTMRSRLDERTEHVQLTQKQRNERTMNSIIARWAIYRTHRSKSSTILTTIPRLGECCIITPRKLNICEVMQWLNRVQGKVASPQNRILKKSVLPKFYFPKNNCLDDPRLKPKLIWDYYSKSKSHVKDIYK